VKAILFSPAVRILLAVLLALSSAACGGGLRVNRINSAQKKPNNVWVFFTVDAGEDEPVGGLTAEDFEIFEDSELVSKFESKQTIQNPEVAAVMYTMLLVDMSGSITESGQADSLVDAAKAFSDRVGKTQKVGVYAFDGEAKIHSVVPFTEAQGSVDGGLEGLRRYKPKDPSTNLHGAVVEGLKELKKALDKDKRPLKFGTLVVFSDGTDRANRVSRDDMKKALDEEAYETYEVFAVGVGAEIEKARLDEIGRDGTELATDQARVKDAFDKIAARIEAHMKRFYLLSYCTPARAGEHEVKITAHRKDPKASGSLEYKFNADGFGPPPDCDPNTPPSFDLKATAPPPEGGGSGGASVKASGSVKVEAK
jgi:von Willebrand factor type A domain